MELSSGTAPGGRPPVWRDRGSRWVSWPHLTQRVPQHLVGTPLLQRGPTGESVRAEDNAHRGGLPCRMSVWAGPVRGMADEPDPGGSPPSPARPKSGRRQPGGVPPRMTRCSAGSSPCPPTPRPSCARSCPPGITARLDLAQLAPGSFVDEALKWRRSDVLFTAPLDGQDGGRPSGRLPGSSRWTSPVHLLDVIDLSPAAGESRHGCPGSDSCSTTSPAPTRPSCSPAT